MIDGSGSISSSDFQTQKDAYASVFGNSSVVPADGSIVANLIQFSTDAQVEQTALRLDDSGDRTMFTNSINNMAQLDGGTDIGEGIDLGVSDMDSFLSPLDDGEFGEDFRKLVDVSTDGQENSGSRDAEDAADDAVNDKGYDAVNCLAVGAGDCSFISGDDGTLGTSDDLGTVFSAGSFDELEPVLENKVRQEFGTEEVPAPATLLLFGLGLLGLGAAARGRAAG